MAFHLWLTLLLPSILLARVPTSTAAAPLKPSFTSSSKSCPEGFVLNGKNCEKLEVLQAVPLCPKGSSEVDGRCLIFSHAERTCLAGFDLHGTKCEKTETIPAERLCQEGKLQGGSCKVVVPQPPVCPRGYVVDARRESAGRCVKYVSKQVNVIKLPAVPECPADMNLEGDVCITYREQKPHCPNGYKNAEAGDCLKPVPKVPVPCPDGYSVVDSHCQRVVRQPVVLVCPNGMQLDAQKKICFTTVPVSPRCPAGFSKAEGGDECERVLSAKAVCPDGTRRVGGKCVRDLLVEKLSDCPRNYVMVGRKCKRVQKFPVDLVCLEGQRQRDQCVWIDQVSPMFACPASYELSKAAPGASKSAGPVCARQVETDCSKTIMQKQCEMPDVVAHVEQRHVQKAGKRMLKELAVAIPRPMSKSPVCTQVPVIIPKTCSKTEFAPLQYTCPENSVLVGKACQIKRMTALTPVCRDGDMDASGRCLKVIATAPRFYCPEGAWESDGSCFRTESQPVSYVCPASSVQLPRGSDADGSLTPACRETLAELQFPARLERLPATPVCATGTLQGDRCVEVLSEPRAFVCPQSSTEVNGACYVVAQQIQPGPIVIRRAPSFVCPDGTVPANRVCLEEERRCPGDADETETGRCAMHAAMVAVPPLVKNVPAVPICEEGFKLSSSRTACQAKYTEAPTFTCPDMFRLSELRDGQCVKEVPMSSVCPMGSFRNAEQQCIKKEVVAPEVTIVKKCTKGEAGC